MMVNGTLVNGWLTRKVMCPRRYAVRSKQSMRTEFKVTKSWLPSLVTKESEFFRQGCTLGCIPGCTLIASFQGRGFHAVTSATVTAGVTAKGAVSERQIIRTNGESWQLVDRG